MSPLFDASPIFFASPLWLLLLLLVPLAALLDRRRAWTGRRAVGIGVRAAALTLLGLALGQPTWDGEEPGTVSVFVLDTSDSTTDAESTRAWTEIMGRRAALDAADRSALVTFDRGARVAVPLDAPWPDAPPAQAGPGSASDVGAALTLANGVVPATHPGRIILFSDGGHTDTLVPSRVPLEVVALDPAPTAPRLLDVVLDQAVVAPGATLTGTVQAMGGRAGLHAAATLMLQGALTRDGALSRAAPSLDEGQSVDTSALDIAPGETGAATFRLDVPADQPAGLATLSATIPGDTLTVGVRVQAAPRVLLVAATSRDGASLAAALEADGLDVRRVSPAGAPADLDAVDLVVLADAPAGGPAAEERPVLGRAFLSALDPWVRGGGGLLVLGGPHAHDLGGYPDSPLAPLLPVIAEPPGQERDLSVTMVIALDKSASMAAPASAGVSAAGITQRMVGGNAEGSKIRLVATAAAAAVGRLRDQDTVGVLAVDSEAKWALPPASAENRVAMARQLGGLKAGGGGIFLVEALRAATVPLTQSTSPVRHLLLFADAADVSQKDAKGPDDTTRTALSLVHDLADAGVTLSVVGVGSESDKDARFLRQLATVGGGRFSLTSDFRRLRALFISETEQVVARSIEEEIPARVRAARDHPAMAGVDLRAAPPLSGFNRLDARQRARTLIETTAGEPILVTWNLGLGEVSAAGIDAGDRWSAGWTRWSGYSRLWTRLTRRLSRDPQGATPGVTLTVDGRTARVTLEDPAPEPQVIVNDGAAIALTLDAPGVWTGAVPATPEALYTLSLVLDGTSEGTSEGPEAAHLDAIAPPSPERAQWATDTAFLETVMASAPGEPRGPARRTTPLGPWLLGLALLLLPLDALLRRGARVSQA
jgi:Ca-activated chloride channel homolog